MKLREGMLDMLRLEHREGWHAGTCIWISQGGPASVVQGFRDPLGLRRHSSCIPAGKGICVFHTSFAHKINFAAIFCGNMCLSCHFCTERGQFNQETLIFQTF